MPSIVSPVRQKVPVRWRPFRPITEQRLACTKAFCDRVAAVSVGWCDPELISRSNESISSWSSVIFSCLLCSIWTSKIDHAFEWNFGLFFLLRAGYFSMIILLGICDWHFKLYPEYNSDTITPSFLDRSIHRPQRISRLRIFSTRLSSSQLCAKRYRPNREGFRFRVSRPPSRSRIEILSIFAGRRCVLHLRAGCLNQTYSSMKEVVASSLFFKEGQRDRKFFFGQHTPKSFTFHSTMHPANLFFPFVEGVSCFWQFRKHSWEERFHPPRGSTWAHILISNETLWDTV